MAAIMSLEVYAEKENSHMNQFIMECRKYGIKVLTPDINKSGKDFIVEEEGIRMPFTAIDGLGDTIVNYILEERSNREFSSLSDLLMRMPKKKLNKKTVIVLIKAGCFDCSQKNRILLINEFFNLRSEAVPQEYTLTWCKEILYQYELQTLGDYITQHPLDGIHIPMLSSYKNEDLCYSAGIITNVKTIKDRNGKHMAFVTVTNLKETIECIMFAHTFKDYKALVQKGYRVAVRGRKEDNKIIANSLEMI